MQTRTAAGFSVSVVENGATTPVDPSKIMSFSFTDNERKVDVLKLSVNNEDLSHFDDPVWVTGRTLRFSFGWAEEGSPIREATIRKVNGGRQLNIEAHAKSVLIDKIQKRRRFDNKTRSQVIQQIATENGFGGAVDIEDTEEVFETITQANYTDAQFLRKLAHLEHFEFFLDFDGLHWHRRKTGQRPIKKFTYYSDPGIGTIQDFNVNTDVTRKPGRIRVKSRDPIERRTVEAVSENATETDRDVLQEAPVVGTPSEEERGLFSQESGNFSEATVDVSTSAPQETAAQEVTRPSNVATEKDAKREAKGRFIKTQQTAVKMTLKLIGEPGVLAKSIIEIENMGRRLSGKYYVQTAVHTLDGSGGYDTELKLITDGFQRRSGGAGGGAGSDKQLQTLIATLTTALAATSKDELTIAGSTLLAKADAVAADPKPSTAKAAAKLAAQLARAAKTAGDPNVASAAANLAAGLRKIGNAQEEQKAEGKLNEKNATDPGELEERGYVADSDGNLTSGYVDTRGRE